MDLTVLCLCISNINLVRALWRLMDCPRAMVWTAWMMWPEPKAMGRRIDMVQAGGDGPPGIIWPEPEAMVRRNDVARAGGDGPPEWCGPSRRRWTAGMICTMKIYGLPSGQGLDRRNLMIWPEPQWPRAAGEAIQALAVHSGGPSPGPKAVHNPL